MTSPSASPRMTAVRHAKPAHTGPALLREDRVRQDALEQLLSGVETQLKALGTALRHRDVPGIDAHAAALRDALQYAVDGFTVAARAGTVPDALRSRLVRAGGQVAAQRETLARATYALDHAIDALMPREGPGIYSARGTTMRSGSGSYSA